MEAVVVFIFIVLALSVGVGIGLLIGRVRAAKAEAKAERLPLLETRLIEMQHQINILNAQNASLSTELHQARQQDKEKFVFLQNARTELGSEFKNLANDILEEKSRYFQETNQQNLGQLLEPLKIRLYEFQKHVEEIYIREGKDRSVLTEQVRQLMELNKTISLEANNLASALKGSQKNQGYWGEMILERILENSGLVKGEEFHVQTNHLNNDGNRLQPDVVLHLPANRHLIIDAKVTLVAYEAYANAESEKDRESALKRHIEAVRSHIKGLSSKKYQELYGLQSLDCVLMFMAIEPAFIASVKHDCELFTDAWKRNVLLVSPSTLLFVLRTIAYLWRQESQSRNAQDIAKRGGELYDKFVAFVEDIESLGNRLRQTQKDYDSAITKLSSGRGNLIRQAEMLKKLGVKPNKSLPMTMIEHANDHVD